jgi:hypothetical protein
MTSARFFTSPHTPGQRQYEALRAHFVEHLPSKEIARKFGYTYAALNSLKQKFKAGKLQFFFTPPRGPKGPRTPPEVKSGIIEYRRKGLSAYQIAEVLDTLGTPVSVSTIARILEEEGFPKLPRRTQLKIGLTRDNTIVPEYAQALDSEELKGLEVECSVGGIFLFAPLLEHYKTLSIIGKAKLPGSPKLSPFHYVMSMLALKLVGKERLSQINDFNFDRGLGLFAGLNVLPKATAISTYSYRLHQREISKFMRYFVEGQNKHKTYGSGTINLDFHTIQHYGEESVLDEHWSGARGKRVKGALTFIAQDCDSRCQLYVNADISKREADNEVLAFVDFWRKIRGARFRQTLVFDSKLTTYENLRTLDADGVKFITLRRRGSRIIESARAIPASEWKRIKLDTPQRKYPNPTVHDSTIMLKDYGEIRQIIVTGNGREEPALLITNDHISSAKEILERYAKRWNFENSIEEAVSFFHLNALSSPILIKIHFDVLLTMISDTLYYQFAQSLRGFEHCDAAKIFRHFVDMPAKISVGVDEILVRYPLRAHAPVLRSAALDKYCPPISWLGNRKIRFEWGSTKDDAKL